MVRKYTRSKSRLREILLILKELLGVVTNVLRIYVRILAQSSPNLISKNKQLSIAVIEVVRIDPSSRGKQLNRRLQLL